MGQNRVSISKNLLEVTGSLLRAGRLWGTAASSALVQARMTDYVYLPEAEELPGTQDFQC